MSVGARAELRRRHRPTLDIVVVNWNSGRYLLECLESIVLADRSGIELQRVVVVDNNSTDGSLDGLDAMPLPLVTMRNAGNRGFAAACNQGAQHSRARYLLFLNPDARLSSDSLTVAMQFMESAPAARVGVCGGQMLGDDGTSAVSCSRFPTLRTYVAKMTGLNVVLPDLFPDQHLSGAETRSSRPVDQVIGAFFFVRGSVFSQLSGFDERYFMYMEDVDFALRASREGYGSYFLSNLRLYHRGNVSSDQVRGDRLFYVLRSRDLYAAEHWPRWRARLLVVLNVVVGLPVRMARSAVVGRQRDEMRATLKGYGRYLAHLTHLAHLAPSRGRRPTHGPPATREPDNGDLGELAAQEEFRWTYEAT